MTTLSMHTSMTTAVPIGGSKTSTATSSSTVNVIRGLDDPFYRYRMNHSEPKLKVMEMVLRRS